MINPKNKRIEITLSSEELELLNSICLRFNISKSRAISQALKVFAAKRKHIITLSYKEADDKKLISEDEILPLDVLLKKARNEEEEDPTWEELLNQLPKNKN